MRATALDRLGSITPEQRSLQDESVRVSRRADADSGWDFNEVRRTAAAANPGSSDASERAQVPEVLATQRESITQIMGSLGPMFRQRAAQYDANGRFALENYAELKAQRAISAPVPCELGGGGASHAQLCQALRELAHFCSSTSLALSMHMHLVAAAVFRYRHGQPGEVLLRKIASSEAVLVSTGAGDWIDSVGWAERVNDGYRINAVKRFCSGCEAGELLISSAPYRDDELGPMVMHFALPMSSPGVNIRYDWDTLGMRATGSHSIELKDAFVPESSVSIRRPSGKWHPVWATTIGVAAPIYTAPYVGIAERAAALALDFARERNQSGITLQMLGELTNELTVAQITWRDMIALTNDYDFEPTVELASAQLVRKTIVTTAAMNSVRKAVELVGGSAYFRQNELERLWRDVQAASFHLLPEKKQQDFTGRVTLGLAPVS